MMKREYLISLGAVIMWGTLAPGNKVLLASIGPMELLFLVSAIAAVFLFVLNGIIGKNRIFRSMKPVDIVILCLLGLIGTFLYNWCYNFGLQRLNVQEACVINYLWPIMTVVFSCFLLRERMTVRKLLAVAISFFGIVVLTTHFDMSSMADINFSGVLACILAAVFYGLFSAWNKRRHYDQFVATAVYYLVTAVVAGAILLANGRTPAAIISEVHGGVQLVTLLWVGIGANAIAYVMWCVGLLNGDTGKVANLAYLTPIMSIVFSRIFLQEEISIFTIFGLVLILLGIAVQMGYNNKTGREKTTSY